jgi:hypothetical protein
LADFCQHAHGSCRSHVPAPTTSHPTSTCPALPQEWLGLYLSALLPALPLLSSTELAHALYAVASLADAVAMGLAMAHRGHGGLPDTAVAAATSSSAAAASVASECPAPSAVSGGGEPSGVTPSPPPPPPRVPAAWHAPRVPAAWHAGALAASQPRLARMPGPALALALVAVARLRRLPHAGWCAAALAAVEARLLPLPGDLPGDRPGCGSPRDVASALWAVAALGLRPSARWRGAALRRCVHLLRSQLAAMDAAAVEEGRERGREAAVGAAADAMQDASVCAAGPATSRHSHSWPGQGTQGDSLASGDGGCGAGPTSQSAQVGGGGPPKAVFLAAARNQLWVEDTASMAVWALSRLGCSEASHPEDWSELLRLSSELVTRGGWLARALHSRRSIGRCILRHLAKLPPATAASVAEAAAATDSHSDTGSRHLRASGAGSAGAPLRAADGTADDARANRLLRGDCTAGSTGSVHDWLPAVGGAVSSTAPVSDTEALVLQGMLHVAAGSRFIKATRVASAAAAGEGEAEGLGQANEGGRVGYAHGSNLQSSDVQAVTGALHAAHGGDGSDAAADHGGFEGGGPRDWSSGDSDVEVGHSLDGDGDHPVDADIFAGSGEGTNRRRRPLLPFQPRRTVGVANAGAVAVL